MTATSSSMISSTTAGAAPATTPTVAATHSTTLNRGAIAGIAVGAAVVIGGLVGVIWACVRRERIKRRDAQPQGLSNAPSYPRGGFTYPKTELELDSPTVAPPSIFRNHSARYGYGSPSQSEQGGWPLHPESLRDSPRNRPNPRFVVAKMSELGDFTAAELPADGEHVIDKERVLRNV